MDNTKQLTELICEATQKTNYKCSDTMKSRCKFKGCCAYCLTIAEYLLNNNVEVHNENNK